MKELINYKRTTRTKHNLRMIIGAAVAMLSISLDSWIFMIPLAIVAGIILPFANDSTIVE